MNRKTFHVTFFLRRARTSKAGLAPILARISTNGISKEVYIQCSVAPEKWSQAKERATGKDKLCQQVNAYLDDYRARIVEMQRELQAKGYEGNCIEIKECRKDLERVLITTSIWKTTSSSRGLCDWQKFVKTSHNAAIFRMQLCIDPARAAGKLFVALPPDRTPHEPHRP